jgi:hypothetical protein
MAGATQERPSFIFQGTIEQLNAATFHGVPVSQRTAVVRVDEVLCGQGVLLEYAKETVTVHLGRSPQLEPGQRAIFFTTDWIYGEGVALREVAPAAAEPDLAGARRKLVNGDPVRLAESLELEARLDDAELIVVGEVATVRVRERDESQPVSFHDPLWHEAVVQVETVEKGRDPEQTVAVWFPASRDVLWHRAPQFEAGQRGVWLLRGGRAGLPPEAHSALHPLDFHAVEDVKRVRSVLVGRKG